MNWLEELDKLNQDYLSLQMSDDIGVSAKIAIKKEELNNLLYAKRHKLINAAKESDAIAKAMNAYPDSDLVSLAKTLATRDKHCAELEERIAKALKYAAGRWSEWGDRAMSVLEILAPEEMPDESKS